MEERIRILRLLEERKISVEEAKTLLEELDKKEAKLHHEKDEFEEKLKTFSNDLGNFLKNTIKIVSDKLSEIFPEEKE
ncbi:MAG: hypothetical protein PHX62_04015 [Bacilli bacterium]|nr:hypothetical protein [Bacilli bacterium]